MILILCSKHQGEKISRRDTITEFKLFPQMLTICTPVCKENSQHFLIVSTLVDFVINNSALFCNRKSFPPSLPPLTTKAAIYLSLWLNSSKPTIQHMHNRKPPLGEERGKESIKNFWTMSTSAERKLSGTFHLMSFIFHSFPTIELFKSFRSAS